MPNKPRSDLTSEQLWYRNYIPNGCRWNFRIHFFQKWLKLRYDFIDMWYLVYLHHVVQEMLFFNMYVTDVFGPSEY